MVVEREERGGCSGDWPARKRAAAGVRMRRMERLLLLARWKEEEEDEERAWRIRGSLMVATLPLAARRRCRFPSLAWLAAMKGGEGVGWLLGGWVLSLLGVVVVVGIMVDEGAASCYCCFRRCATSSIPLGRE